MRPYVKGTNIAGTVYGDADYVMLGEVTGGCDWYLYQSYLNENELDSVMNYCFRDWITGFANGEAPSGFDWAYNSFRALFPQPTFFSMMNLISTHDSPRMLSLLNEDHDKLKLAVMAQMTLPGAPSVYYGDEVALAGQGDPDNRRVYPWADLGGGMNHFMPDTSMYNHFRTLIGLRNNYQVLRRGDVATALVDDAQGLYSYVRYDASGTAVVVLNNSLSAGTATVPVASYLADDTMLTDVLNGGSYTVTSGAVSVPVNAQWGVILVSLTLPASAAPVPAMPDVAITWTVVDASCEYNVYRGTLPGFAIPDGTLLTPTPLPASTTTYTDSSITGSSAINYYYLVEAVNCSSGVPARSRHMGEFDFDITPGS